MGEHLGMHARSCSMARSWPSGRTAGPASPACRTGCTCPIPRKPAGGRRRIRCTSWPSTCSTPDGRSLMADPYDARRARLEALGFSGANFTTTECFRDVSGRDVLRATTENGLEGVVAKRRDSTYRPGRRVAEWVKVKVVTTQEVVVGGWTDGKGGRGASLGSLLLGIPGAGRPRLRRQGRHRLRRPGPPVDRGAVEGAGSRTNPFGGTITASRGQGCALRPSQPGRRGRATASGPPPVGSATRPGAACGPTRRRPTSAASRRPRRANPTTPDRPRSRPAPTSPVGQQRLATRTRGRARAVRHQPRQGALPRDRVHQGTADRLLRPHRPGHAAAPRGATPHHEALPRRRRGKVLLREARALAHPPLGQDADAFPPNARARSPTPSCRTCRR